jgi:hypothetical protein
LAAGGIGSAAFVSPELVFVVLVVLQVGEAGVSSITSEPTVGARAFALVGGRDGMVLNGSCVVVGRDIPG